ncbi:MAG: TonB-dependent receptor [Salegentibacter sp.]|uniref:TonB-dependent receptor n=1 Tax=Salegentibacter flavus TaxID=287099 RepID=A0A1I5AR13_9FLAO|nr:MULTISPECIES: TonB-dependent receptor [Salegentibacter]MDR9456660.1 TonB-dependent receptor [Salegentibacter sp.]SFN64873.1 TonB-dependent receptor [Salegentibacter flavus]
MKTQFSVVLFFCLFISFAQAQTGKISGSIYDVEANDVMPFANVTIKGTNTGTTSDFEGDYSLNAAPGTYTVVFSFVGYETVEVSEVIVEEGKVTSLNVEMKSSAGALDEVIITTTTARDTEASVLNMQRNAVNLTDGLSSQTFDKIGAGEVSSAVKTIPGVSVQGGKYVYVRGLGDRYTKSILNGMDVPGLDPDRNTLQMDIFPTNILDNVMVIKSLTADNPADFTGGMVNIITKDFPTREEYSVSLGATYNPSMHFNSDFLQYDGGGTDFLGFDDGTRDRPVNRNQAFPRPFDNDAALTRLTERFNPTLGGTRQQNNMDFSLGFTAGNQYDVGKKNNKLGYIASLSYKNTTEYFEDFENNSWLKPRETSEFELRPSRLLSGDVGKENTLISALTGLAFKTEQSKYQLNLLHIQNGESTAGNFEEEILVSDAIRVFRDNLEYTQRSITNALLSGKHTNKDASWTTEWKLSPSLSRVYDKDVRITAFEYNPSNNTFSIRPSSSESPTRIWRNLEEINLAGKVGLKKEHQLFGRNASLKFGGGYTYKQRDFTIDQYQILIQGSISQRFEGNPNQVLAPGNIWTPENQAGSYINGFYEPANTYDAYNTNASAYVSEEFNVTENLKAILGLRLEKFDLFYTGQNNLGDLILEDEHLIDKADLFPSANFIYSLNNDSNLRLSYGRSTARPSFKEASIAQIYDPLTNRTFIGNIDLQPTYVDNIDARYELYGDDAQLFAVSAFYKKFTDPIELSVYSDFSADNFQPRNVNDATVVGAEIEIRKNFGFITEGLRKLSVNLNVSVIDSKVEMDRSPSGEFESRQRNLRPGEEFDGTRQLQGQSPLLINAGFDYTDSESGWQAGVFYNTQGKTLELVGLGTVPDVYTMPFHSLNFNLNKSFGEEKNSTISLKISNILGDNIESRFQSFGAEDQIFSLKKPGTPISLSYSYKF